MDASLHITLDKLVRKYAAFGLCPERFTQMRRLAGILGREQGIAPDALLDAMIEDIDSEVSA